MKSRLLAARCQEAACLQHTASPKPTLQSTRMLLLNLQLPSSGGSQNPEQKPWGSPIIWKEMHTPTQGTHAKGADIKCLLHVQRHILPPHRSRVTTAEALTPALGHVKGASKQHICHFQNHLPMQEQRLYS